MSKLDYSDSDQSIHEPHLPIFVYGTLLNGFHNHESFILPQAKIQSAYLSGVDLYHFDGRGYPGIIAGKSKVLGEVVMVDPIDWSHQIRILDELEEYYGVKDSRNYYDRRVVQVNLVEKDINCAHENQVRHKSIEAWAYFALHNLADIQATHVTHGDWRRHLYESGESDAIENWLQRGTSFQRTLD